MLQSNRVLASWKRLDLAYSGLRIVAKFKAIRDNAIYEDPNRVANLREEMQENAADIWVSLRAIQDRVKEIREFLGAATDEGLRCAGQSGRWPLMKRRQLYSWSNLLNN